MMCFGSGASEAHLTKTAVESEIHGQGTPEHQVISAMPHPPPPIWARPHNRSLQPFYLSYFYKKERAFVTKIKQNTAVKAMRGPTTDLLLRGPPALPHSCAPPQPPYARSQDPVWKAVTWLPTGNQHLSL